MNPSTLSRTAGLAGTLSILLGLATAPLIAWPLPLAAIGAGMMLVTLAAPFTGLK